MTPKLTVFFIVEPPEYQVMACYLAASLREQFGDTVALVGYCPAPRLGQVHADVRAALDRMRCDLRTFETEGRFSPAYPHGNKILATLEPRETEFSCFMDSDILCLRPNQADNLVQPGAVSLTPAASMSWASQAIWPSLYGIFGMDVPQDRIRLMRQRKGKGRVPYFSSGLFSFPERHRTPEGKSFPEVWMDTAQTLDRHDEIPHKRPYLDQISLPIAIQRAGLTWNLLPEEQHYILGGRSRGEPLPQGREIYTVHYRQWPIVKEIGLASFAKQVLLAHAGVKKVAQVPKTKAPRAKAPRTGASAADAADGACISDGAA